MNNKMIITAEAYNKKITFELPVDIDIYDFMDACRSVAICLTYHEDMWDGAILEKAEIINDERTRKSINGNV